MVLLGGLELAAAGYLIHKHQQNKRDKQRLQEEAAALEEGQYRIFPPEDRHSRPEHRRRRSHSRRRHSEERYGRRYRPHSHDGKYRRESPSPRPKPILKPTNYSNPQLAQQRPPPYPAVVAAGPPPMASAAQHPVQRPAPPGSQPPPQSQAQSYPQDVKYGWTDDQQQQRPSHDSTFPPTGWPSEWQQSPGASSSSLPSQQQQQQQQQQRQRADSSRDRSDRRLEDSSRVRFSAPRHSPSVRSLTRSPPPSYRA